MSALEINGIHWNTSLFSSEWGISQPLHLSASDWRVKCEKSRVREQWGPLFDWLSVLLLYTAALSPPAECDYHSDQPITSTVSSFPPVLKQSSLVLSLFDSLWLISYIFFLHSVPFPLYISITNMSTDGKAGYLLTWEPRGTQLSSWMV